MKILVYSDLHLHNHRGLLYNSEIALDILSKIKNYCSKNNIDKVVCAGDFFHTKARAYAPHVVQALLRLKDFNKNNIEQFMLVGNHDMATPNNSMNSILFVFSDYVKVVPDYYFIDVESTRIHFLSYTNEAFDNFILAEDKKNVLITHIDIIGFTMSNGFRATNGFKLSDLKDFDLVISGHYHKHQTKENVVYVGSPYQTNYGERNQEHGFLIFDTDTLEWHLETINDVPEYKVYEVDNINQLKEKDVNNNFLRIKLYNQDIRKSSLKEKLFEMGALSVEIIPFEDIQEIEKYYDKELSDDPSDIAAAYIESINNLSLKKEKLLKYFDKIQDVANNITDYEI
jgi:DNA repair exonuclease SbcCD nuclease subunit